MAEGFTEGIGVTARNAECDAGTVRNCADAGLIECRRLASGMRLFRPSAAAEIRKLLVQRLARRGRRPSAA